MTIELYNIVEVHASWKACHGTTHFTTYCSLGLIVAVVHDEIGESPTGRSQLVSQNMYKEDVTLSKSSQNKST